MTTTTTTLAEDGTAIYVGTGSGHFGWSDAYGDNSGEWEDLATNDYDIERFGTNAPLGPTLFPLLVHRIDEVLTVHLPPRPANDYNGVAIVDLTVDETGRFEVSENYYPQRVRDAVNDRPTHHGPWCDEALVPCEACTAGDGPNHPKATT